MQRPDNLMAQFLGKAAAEVYRGSGAWPLQPHPCDLEPPWDRFDRSSLSLWDCMFNGWEAPWEGSLLRRFLSDDRVYDQNRPVVLPERGSSDGSDLAIVTFEQYPEDESTVPKGEELLRSLVSLSRPVSFEIVGMGTTPRFDHEKAAEVFRARAAGEKRELSEAICGWTEPYVRAQFVAHKTDAPWIERLLLTHYPNSAVVRGDDLSGDDVSNAIANDIRYGDGWACTLSLQNGYCYPLRTFTRLDPDPLGVVVSSMDDLGEYDWALLQVFFQPAQQPWGETLGEAVVEPYRGEFLDASLSDKLLREKFSSPLFACSIRIASKREDVYRQLKGWAQQYASPPQEFDSELDDGEANCLSTAVETRCTFRPGVLLNTHELAGLVHLPSGSVPSERLRKFRSRTRAAAETNELAGSVLLGENLHRGKLRKARLPLEQRLKHCYIAGATGTGKIPGDRVWSES